MKDEVTVVIPARYGSTRLPGKPLIHVAGCPLILHVLQRAREIPDVDRIIVATDDERIVRAVSDAGYEAVMTPENMPSGSDRVGWVAKKLTSDIVVNLQGDEPLIDTNAVKKAIEVVKQDGQIPVSTLGFPIRLETTWKNPNVVKVITDENNFALYFSRLPIPYFRDGRFIPLPILYQHLGVYVYRRKQLLQFITWESSPLENAEKLEQLRILSRGYKIKVIPAVAASPGVDTAHDIETVEKILKERGWLLEQKNS
jgi:3-deoxy-manno-octulosonate cytidylyltransferase (CMP-KDO synthetase)